MATKRQFIAVAIALGLVGATGIAGISGCTAKVESANAKTDAPPAGRTSDPQVAARPPDVRDAARPPATEPPRRPSGLPSSVKEVTFDDIKLDLKKGDLFNPALLTDKVKALAGSSIRIRGYILPSFQQEGIKQFVLVRDNMECCFGPGALLHDCILVEMVPPATATFTVRPVSVEGTFSLHDVKDPVNGKYLAIYHLDGKQVK